MAALYEDDLAYIQAEAFGDLASTAAPALVGRLNAADPQVRRVVDVGCGAGVTTRAFCDAGFDVVAIDASNALLELARRAAPAARFIHGSAYDVQLPACDAIVALGEPLTYHPPDIDGDERVRGFIDKAALALGAGGLFVFDIIVTGDAPLGASGWQSECDWAILYETREDRDAGRLVRNIETFRKVGRDYRRSREVHHVRIFEEHAVVEWLRSRGFDVETARSYGQVKLSSRRVAFFAQKAG